MNIIRYPKREDWASITERPQLDTSTLNATVSNILGDIKANGDEAVRKYEEMFDHVRLDSLAVSENEIEEAWNSVPAEL